MQSYLSKDRMGAARKDKRGFGITAKAGVPPIVAGAGKTSSLKWEVRRLIYMGVVLVNQVPRPSFLTP